jgi:UDP-2,4-diacetamido-2,4,6-trideoxy-beta-L-altropyranose hydrolase
VKDKQRIIFRTGGGRQAGYGHIRRCLSLAEAIRRLGAECLFLLDGDSVILEKVMAEDFQVIRIRAEDDLAETIRLIRSCEARAIIVDAYNLQQDYLCCLSQTKALVVVIDDMADRELLVDLIINGSVGADQLVYRGLTKTRYLLGPQFILLRQEFEQEPMRDISAEVRRVLITVGGSDPRKVSVRLIQWVSQTLPGVHLDVAIGPLFEISEPIIPNGTGNSCTMTVHCDPKDMRDLMLSADLAVCGGGQTTYELAATGTPAVAIRLFDNQTRNLAGLSARGILEWVGDVRDAGLENQVIAALQDLGENPDKRMKMSRAGRALVDGGGARRVAQEVLETCST